MNPIIEETIYVDFITSLPSTGAAADADATPVCEVFEDATDTAILSPTVAKRTGKTGDYRVPIICSAANGFESPKSYNVVVAATVGGVAAKAVVSTFQVRTAPSTSVGATPAQVQAELVTYGAAKPGSAMTLTPSYDSAKTAASQSTVDAIAVIVAAIKVIDDRLSTTLETDGPVYRFTANALEQAPAGGGGSVTVDNNAIADAILKRDWTLISGEAIYSLLNAARMLRNVWDTAGGTLKVRKEDGTTVAWQRTLAVDPNAQPIVGAS
jgi:hypothetical protein